MGFARGHWRSPAHVLIPFYDRSRSAFDEVVKDTFHGHLSLFVGSEAIGLSSWNMPTRLHVLWCCSYHSSAAAG